jgi:hypothetical protein
MQPSLIIYFLLILFLLHAAVINAAVNSVESGASLGTNYDSNVNRTPDNEISQWETTLRGFIELSREGQKGSLHLQFIPTFKYTYRTAETDNSIDYALNFLASRKLSDRFQFNIINFFNHTDDLGAENFTLSTTSSTNEEQDVLTDTSEENSFRPDLTLSDRIGRQELTDNYLSTSLVYEYARNSLVTLGYDNRILKYDEPGNDNYMYNSPWTILSFWFNPQWNTSLAYKYTDAEFDLSEDFITHDLGFNLNFMFSKHDRVAATIEYFKKDYEILQEDFINQLSDFYAVYAQLGWRHYFSPHRTISISAGPIFLHINNENDDSTIPYFNIDYRRGFENGFWYIRAEGGLADRSFEAADEGLSEFLQLSEGIRLQVAKNVSANFSVYLRNDNLLETYTEYDEKTFNATADLTYEFARWYFLSALYGFNKLNSDIDSNDYVDHRFFITLGFSKEMYRW